jgi:hypothetical protein
MFRAAFRGSRPRRSGLPAQSPGASIRQAAMLLQLAESFPLTVPLPSAWPSTAPSQAAGNASGWP